MAEAPTLEVERSLVGTLELEGTDVPYLNLEDFPAIPTQLRVAGVDYSYVRSFPIQGHSAVLPRAIAEVREASKQPVIAERNERYILFVA